MKIITFQSNGDAPFDFEAFRRQESSLIFLNLAVLASLSVVHIFFFPLLGPPSKYLLMALAARFLSQVCELFWLQSLKESLRAPIARLYSQGSIWLNLAFAFLASYLGGAADSHYWVLMVLPVISAAFRFGIAGTLSIVTIAASLTFLQVWLYFKRQPPADISEYFEAATVGLIFIVVAVVVRLLVGYLWREQAALRRSLAELQQARDKLVVEEKLAAEAFIQTEVDCPDDLIAVIDDSQMQQALLNLLLNATQAAPEYGHVRIGAYAGAGRELNLYVEDSGPAVSRAALSRIFEPFFTTTPGGTGLGLAIVRNIARAHGGEVTLAVNEPGRVRFLLTLPRATVAASAEASEEADGAHSHR